MPEPESGTGPDPVPAPAGDAALQDFAAKIFNLARSGDPRALGAYLDAGVPANLTNDHGDTLVMLPLITGMPPRCGSCWSTAPTPAAGHPSAVDTARMFGNQEFLAWFAESQPE